MIVAGTTLSVAVVGLCASIVVGLGSVSGAHLAAQRVTAAADAAALAAADAASGAISGTPCTRAAQIADSMGSNVVACDVSGLIATVEVASSFATIPVRGRARAGPAMTAGAESTP